jgi:cytochrome b
MNRQVGVIRQYRVWDRTTRVFHWINFLCVLVLAVLGTIMLNGKLLGLTPGGSLLVKNLHAYTGYAFAANLAWRLLWAFIGNKYARWRALLPFGQGFVQALREQLRGLGGGHEPAYVGHSPLARIMIVGMLLLLATQAITGLLLASTDLYLPPLGGYMAEWVTNGDPEKLKLLQPGSTENVVRDSYDAMKAFRKPFKLTHEYGFYLLLVMIVLHIFANILEEARQSTGQISAMFSGVKTLTGKPVDNPGD